MALLVGLDLQIRVARKPGSVRLDMLVQSRNKDMEVAAFVLPEEFFRAAYIQAANLP